ncbi:hypothetical protein A6D72_26835 [Klebsiella pneumoniae]|nr:hypothetical protein LQ47_04825 [Klebsiella pneumoniae]AMV50632.1 hypothetical protein AOD72_06750 [Klebsiella pneumoniae subsp. pneumoniae]AMV55780.1 hypothetical protein AOG31_06380 [Klebsiella pneumoniae subsp. pneumoniae]KRR32927.1 hypothetical protein AN412_17405 [Klebsiella pneumoniae]KSY95051.1 hypothetical protein APU14_20570 [Klebsiella pneumoniae]
MSFQNSYKTILESLKFTRGMRDNPLSTISFRYGVNLISIRCIKKEAVNLPTVSRLNFDQFRIEVKAHP